jgi:hypothetical protein
VKADAAEEEIEEFKKPPLAAPWAMGDSWMAYFMENPIRMDDCEVPPYFRKPSYFFKYG